MDNKSLGGWLLGLSIAEGALLLMVAGSSGTDFTSLLGLALVAQFVFAIMGARRLMK